MKKSNRFLPTTIILAIIGLHFSTVNASAWFDETHLAIAKAAEYSKWYHAAGADIAKIKAGDIEADNHYSNNAPETVITPGMVLAQAPRYNKPEDTGHLYGAIVASLREYVSRKKAGKFADYHLAYTIHYIGDLSQPLHNTLHNAFNRQNHLKFDGIINDRILDNPDKIKIYKLVINSEDGLVKEIARIAGLSMELGYKLESENRIFSGEGGVGLGGERWDDWGIDAGIRCEELIGSFQGPTECSGSMVAFQTGIASNAHVSSEYKSLADWV